MSKVIVKKEGHVAILTLNRTEALNAFNTELMGDLVGAIDEAGKDPDVYVIVINSSMEKVFTAGGDIKEEAGCTYDTAYDFSKNGQECVMSLYKSPVPVILAVDGHTLGAGLELILAADITVAAKTAKIGIPTINLAGIPCCTGTQLLPRVVGVSTACDILLTGKIMSAEECYRLHLVEYLTEKEELMDKAMEVANTIADKSPWAVKMMRDSIKKGITMPLDDALELERNIFQECYTNSDRMEGTKAFLEKRPHRAYNNRGEWIK